MQRRACLRRLPVGGLSGRGGRAALTSAPALACVLATRRCLQRCCPCLRRGGKAGCRSVLGGGEILNSHELT